MSADCRRHGYCSTDPSDSVHSTPKATRNLSFLAIRRFKLILLTTISPVANGGFAVFTL